MRLFAAIPPPPAVIAQADAVQEAFSIPPRLVRWTPPGQRHLTLKFFGEVADDVAERIEAALRDAAGGVGLFALRTGAVGAFPNSSRARVLWLGIEGDTERLVALESAITAQTAFVTSDRLQRFTPHLTLGRVRPGVSPQGLRDIRRALAIIDPGAPIPWPVNELHLIESRLSPKGAEHIVRAVFSL